jgi:TonB family protein
MLWAAGKDGTLMATERRQHPRKTPAEFTFIQLEQEFNGRVMNYSKDGICFETSLPIPDDELVQFWVAFREHGEIDGVGRLRWINDKRNLGGMSFVHLSRSSRQKLDDWVGGQATAEGAPAGHDPAAAESLAHTLAEQTEREFVEAIKSLLTLPNFARNVQAGVAIGATTVKTQPAPTNQSAAAPAVTPPAKEAVDSSAAGAAAGPNKHATEPIDALSAPAEPEFTAASAETVSAWSKGEPTAAKSWEVKPAPCGEVAPSESVPDNELSREIAAEPEEVRPPTVSQTAGPAPAGSSDGQSREGVPKWLFSLPSDGPASPTTPPVDEPVVLETEELEEEGTRQLVPLRQHLYARRLQFIRGAAIGIVASLAIAIAVFKFRRPPAQAILTEETPPAVSANSPGSGAGLVPVPVLSVEHTSRNPESRKKREDLPAQTATHLPMQGESSQPPGSLRPPDANASDPATEPAANSASANAIARPSSFAHREANQATGMQPFFELSKQGSFAGSPGEGELGDSRTPQRPEVDLGATAFSFHTKNIAEAPRVGGVAERTELLHSVAPIYPEIAKLHQISGDVVINATIDAKGRVRNAQVVSGPVLLRTSALSAVSQWKYRPAMLNGRPVEAHESITIRFRQQ